MFKSFFLGGFECATGYNREGNWIDLVADTWHHRHADGDYRRLREVGIHAVRDAIRWPVVDPGSGNFNFSSVEPIVRAARKHGVEVVWDLFHFGYPDGLDLMSDSFAPRFSDYCAACARYLRERTDGPLWFTPVNEPSYFSWAAGEAGRFAPYLSGRQYDLKVALVRAAIRGIDAIRAEVGEVRFLHADPLCRVAAPDDNPASVEAARLFNEHQVFETWDMLCGLHRPDLGGSRSHLDVIGINYYWNCQWVHGQEGTWLDDDDPRRVPLCTLVQEVSDRYGGDLIISETSHWGEHRAEWMLHLAEEIEVLLDASVPLCGVCIYPIIGMFDWHAPRPFMPMGLWDLDSTRRMRRVVHQPMLDALSSAQERVRRNLESNPRRPRITPVRCP
jgi:hypothetical protein